MALRAGRQIMSAANCQLDGAGEAKARDEFNHQAVDGPPTLSVKVKTGCPWSRMHLLVGSCLW